MLMSFALTDTLPQSTSRTYQSWDFEASYASLKQYGGTDGSDMVGDVEFDAFSARNDSPQHGQGEKRVSWVDHFSSLSEEKALMFDSMPAFFSNHDSEMRYSEKQFRQKHNLQAVIRAGCLSANETLILEPKAESVVVLCFRPSDKGVRGKSKIRPIERHVSVSMIDFDRLRLVDLPEMTSKQMCHMAKFASRRRPCCMCRPLSSLLLSAPAFAHFLHFLLLWLPSSLPSC